MNESLYGRYMRDPLPIRLGNLSSSLGRLADSINRPERRQIALDMINECKWFIEWTGAEAQTEVAADLVRIQVTLAGWQRMLIGHAKLDCDMGEYAAEARQSSENVLQMSGLLDVEDL